MSLEAWTRKYPTGIVTPSTYLDHIEADTWWHQQRARLAHRTAMFSNTEHTQKVNAA